MPVGAAVPRDRRVSPRRRCRRPIGAGVLAAIPGNVWGRKWVSFCKHYGHGNDAVLTYLSRYVFRTAISNARTSRQGPNPCDLPLERSRLATRGASSGCRALSSSGTPPARLAARLSQGPILRALAPLEARPVQSCLVALDPGDAGRRRASQDIKPLGGVERADGTGRSSCRRGGGSRRGPAAMSPLR